MHRLRMVVALLWHQVRGHVLAFDSVGGERPTGWRCWTCGTKWEGGLGDEFLAQDRGGFLFNDEQTPPNYLTYRNIYRRA